MSNTGIDLIIKPSTPSIGYDDETTDEDGNFFSITVPSVIPFIFNEDGSTTTPDNFEIKNFSINDVNINNIYLELTDKDWGIHQVESNYNPGDYFKNKGYNYQEIELLIGEKDKDNKVSVGTIEDENHISNNMIVEGIKTLNSNDYNSITLDFDVYRTLFTEASTVHNAYIMHIDFVFSNDSKEDQDPPIESDFDPDTDAIVGYVAFKNSKAPKVLGTIYFDGTNDTYNILSDSSAEDLTAKESKVVVKGKQINGDYHIVSTSRIFADSYIGYFFSSCQAKIIDVTNLNTSNVTDMSNYFYNCKNLTEIRGMNLWNMENIVSTYRMFYGCSSLESLDIRNFNTKNVTDMSSMFYNCTSLSSIIGISDIITNKVANMSGMFQNCSKLTNLDVSNWNTSAVTEMSSIFSGCELLESINGINNWTTNNVQKMDAMFKNCYALNNIILSSWNTENVTTMMDMFNGCKSFTTLDISNFNTTNTSSSSSKVLRLAANCDKLTTIILSPEMLTTNLPTVTSSTNSLFYVENNTITTVIGASDAIKSYKWAKDNRTVTFKDTLD